MSLTSKRSAHLLPIASKWSWTISPILAANRPDKIRNSLPSSSEL